MPVTTTFLTAFLKLSLAGRTTFVEYRTRRKYGQAHLYDPKTEGKPDPFRHATEISLRGNPWNVFDFLSGVAIFR